MKHRGNLSQAENSIGNLPDLKNINMRADLRTRHLDALPWPSKFSDEEKKFHATACGIDTKSSLIAGAYLAKELSQLADIERHLSICMGIIASSCGRSTFLAGSEISNALLHFAAEEYMHSNMFTRFVEILTGQNFDLSHNTIDERIKVFQGTESLESKLVALVASAYPGESVMTAMEQRLKHLDKKENYFLTKLFAAHGLDESRHIDFDHFIFDNLLPKLSAAELLDAQKLYSKIMIANRDLGNQYTVAISGYFGFDFITGNPIAQFQQELTHQLSTEMLKTTEKNRADSFLTAELKNQLIEFIFAKNIHFQ